MNMRIVNEQYEITDDNGKVFFVDKSTADLNTNVEKFVYIEVLFMGAVIDGVRA